MKGLEVSGDAGSFGTYSGRGTYGNKWNNGLEAVFSGSYYNSNGQDLFFKEFDHPQTNNGFAKNCDYDSFYHFFSDISWGDFNLQGLYGSRLKGIPTGSFGTVFDDDRNRTLDETSYIDLKYDHQFQSGYELTARVSINHYLYKGDYVYDHIVPINPLERVIEQDYGRGNWAGTDVQLSKMFYDKHYVILGYDFMGNFNQDQGASDLGYAKLFDSSKSSYNMGFYLQDEFRIRKDLILNAGVRYDLYSTFGGTINPRAGLIYMPTETTDFKLLYGTAFRAPNAYELYYDDENPRKET